MTLIPGEPLPRFSLSAAGLSWEAHETGSKARLRGLSAAGTEVVWASGTGGTFARSTDGGRSWKAGIVAGAEELDFRDVQAVDDRTAYLLAAGPGDRSRIVKTTDAGASWSVQFVNLDPKGFLDAIAFRDARRGLALGDPIDGRFVILTTSDGGSHWSPIDPKGMPPSLPGEGAFAASGTCLAVGPDGGGDGDGDGLALFGTGGGAGATARVFRSEDGGKTWTAAPVPIRCDGKTAGVFSVAFRDAQHGLAVGGDYAKPDGADRVAATTEDGGRTWSLPTGRGPSGYRSAVAFAPKLGPMAFVAVGPSGADVSLDDGRTWSPIGRDGFHALAASPDGPLCASGDDGKVARLVGEH